MVYLKNHWTNARHVYTHLYTFCRGVRVPLFSWIPLFWNFFCAKISAFPSIFSLFLTVYPDFTLFFLIFCPWPLTPLILEAFACWIQIWLWQFEFWKFWGSSESWDLSSAAVTWMERSEVEKILKPSQKPLQWVTVLSRIKVNTYFFVRKKKKKIIFMLYSCSPRRVSRNYALCMRRCLLCSSNMSVMHSALAFTRVNRTDASAKH